MLTIVLVAAAELFWRSQGHLPTVTDDKVLWANNRSQVYGRGDSNAIVVLGASRAQVGIVPEVLEEQFPEHRVLHLAVDGQPGYATFKDLAEDPNFDGLIIFSSLAHTFLPENQTDQQPWVDYYHDQWSKLSRIEKYINMKVRVFLQSHLVIFTSRLNLREQLANQFNIVPNYVYMQANRYRPAFYFDRMTPEIREENRLWRLEGVASRDNSSTPEKKLEFEQILNTQVASLVAQLRSHGGDVVFLRMPTCDEHWEFDEARAPKDQYWDQIEKLTGADTIHFEDVEGLSNFECPDSSHLDARDAPIFTERLARELKNRNLP
jgi:hypothetical protein